MTTPIDRESVERLAHRARGCADIMRRYKAASIEASELSGFANTLLALRAALDAAEGEVRKWQANHDTWRATALSVEAENKRLREALQEVKYDCLERAAASRDRKTVPISNETWRQLLAALQENPDG